MDNQLQSDRTITEAARDSGGRFAHLHVHTEYSLLDGSNKIKEYVARVKELGMDSAAITDHGVMYGVIDFYKEAKAQGINPILGCEVYVSPGSRFDRESGRQGEDRYYHLILLAENNRGYENLMKIVSAGFVDGYYYKPRVDMEILERYHEGLISTSACLAGEVQKFLTRGFYEEAKTAALKYEAVFGHGNFFLELQDHGLEMQKRINPLLVRLSRETGIRLVCTNDCHYTNAEDAEAHDILLCIQTQKKVADEDRMRYEGGQYYVKSPGQMAQLFPYAPEALENTWKIAQRCHVELEFGVTKLPKFEVPEGYTSWEYLNKLCWEGLEQRYQPVTQELRDRLTYELGVIQKMGYVDYFLIVWDFIHFARQNDIMVGPGRGSAAGSLVSYSLDITQLDPMRYQLLFERFLNPERVSMPDIDVDFGFERRQEVIDYVVRKYGKDRVAQIVTFGTMQAKGVIRDVGRALDLPYSLCDSIAKMIPADQQQKKTTIADALRMNRELSTLYEQDERIHYLIDMARRLEGLPRHTSMHAAGVVICQESVVEYVPLSRGADGSLTTQFTMTALEELGLLKMDFLGLRTLTVIQNAVRMAEKSSGHPIDMNRIDYDDKKVYSYISTGRTEGIFQIESAGMKSFMKELAPDCLEDLIAGISLYRPGPMDFIPQYIRGKNNREGIRYDCPQLVPILEATYGCIVYQEQVMQIVRELAGYSLGRSDLVRRAMSKKKAAVMQKERKNFVYGNEAEEVPGCVANGISEETANKIFDEMTDFASYAFNKSHAAAYAVVSYQTAWLKYYYPVEYMASLMTSVIDNPGKVAEYIMTCRQMKVRILPPNINEGEAGFSVKDGAVCYGLSAIRSVGRPVIEAIIAERERGGAFSDLRDFTERCSGREINKRAVENFIKAGALDCLGGNRRQLMLVYAQVMDASSREKKNAMSGQMSLFDLMGENEKQKYAVPLPNVQEFDREQLLMFEKEVLGIYVSGHPMEEYEGRWAGQVTARSTDFIPDEETGKPSVKNGQQVIVGGMSAEKTIKYTKDNKTMAFLTLEDLVGSLEVILFPKCYERFHTLLDADAKLFVEGRVSEEEDKPSKVIADRVWRFEDVPSDVWVQFPTMQAYEEGAPKLSPLLQGGTGRDEIILFIRDTKQIRRLGPENSVRADRSFLDALRGAFGGENVRVTEHKER